MTRKLKAKPPKARSNAPQAPSSTVNRSFSIYAVLSVCVVAGAMWFASKQAVNGHDPAASITTLSSTQLVQHMRWEIPCHVRKKARGHVDGCHLVGSGCARVVRDQFVSADEVDALREIAETGMANRSRLGGPTIMDINTGFVKDGDGLVNIYQRDHTAQPTPRFTREQFDLYRRVIERIRLAIMDEFGLNTLHFTAPTFITRAIGNASWVPADMHDEYWHLHVDKDNTAHYDYSGLLYLAEYKEDFTGGVLLFKDGKKRQVIEPARGRLMMFTSGKENLHQVRKVESGTRYVMSMWFTCDERKRFENFLDGRMHKHFVRTD